MNITASRRGFLRGIAGAAALGAGGCFSIGRGRNGKIRLAAVGVMGKGYSDWTPMIKTGLAEMVAFCDADYSMREKAQMALIRDGIDLDMYEIPFYTDYRKLLDDAGVLGIDAGVLATDALVFCTDALCLVFGHLRVNLNEVVGFGLDARHVDDTEPPLRVCQSMAGIAGLQRAIDTQTRRVLHYGCIAVDSSGVVSPLPRLAYLIANFLNLIFHIFLLLRYIVITLYRANCKAL